MWKLELSGITVVERLLSLSVMLRDPDCDDTRIMCTLTADVIIESKHVDTPLVRCVVLMAV